MVGDVRFHKIFAPIVWQWCFDELQLQLIQIFSAGYDKKIFQEVHADLKVKSTANNL